MAKISKDLFGNAAKSRKEQQEKIEAGIKLESSAEQKTGRGRPIKNNEPCVTVTFRMTENRKHRLKVYAANKDKTISDVIAEFVDSLPE